MDRLHDELRAAASRARTQAPAGPRAVPARLNLSCLQSEPVNDGRVNQILQGEAQRTEGVVVHISEICQAQATTFVHTAFSVILGRAPSDAEFKVQMALLGQGWSKIEVLGNLRWSAEGRRKGVNVPWLWPRYLLQKAMHLPLVGYLLQWVVSAAGLPKIVRHQRAADAFHVSHADAMSVSIRVLRDELNALHADCLRLQQERNVLFAQQAEQQNVNSTFQTALEATGGLAMQSNQQVLGMNHWLASLRQSISALELEEDKLGRDWVESHGNFIHAFMQTDGDRPERLAAWLDGFAGNLPADAQVLDIGGGQDWLSQLFLRMPDAKSLQITPTLTANVNDRRVSIGADLESLLPRLERESLHGLCILEASSLAREIPLLKLLRHAARILRPNARLLVGLDRGPRMIAGRLMGHEPLQLEVTLLEAAMKLCGFDRLEVSTVNGISCVLAQKAASGEGGART